MRDVEAAVGRHGLCGFDQLFRRGEVRGRIDQRRRNAECAAFHRPAHHLAHAVQLRGGRCALAHAHRVAAHVVAAEK